MAKPDTGASTPVTTKTEALGQIEIKSGTVPARSEVGTGPYFMAGSVPSGDPEPVDAESDRYVFRIGSTSQSERVAITIDATQLTEQARVRKINRAIQRTRR